MTEQHKPVALGFDIETASADRLYGETHDGGPYVRLMGVQGDGGPVIESDPGEMVPALQAADAVYGHNIFRFDIPALARHAGADYDTLAAKAWDTAILERLVDPPGAKHATKAGYYGLDETAQRYGHDGKSDDLKALALRHAGDEPGTKAQKVDIGFERIPQDDPEYRDYLRGDLAATQHVQRSVFRRVTDWDYARREMKVAAFQNRMAFNGWRVDRGLLAERVREEDTRRSAAVEILHRDYGVPLTKADGGQSAAPWATDAGRAALEDAFRQLGAEYMPRTAPSKGYPDGKLALGKEPMGRGEHGDEGWWVNFEKRRRPTVPAYYADNPGVLALCEVLTEATGASAKYAEIANHMTREGRVHGGIGEDQASGRWAMTKPSLTNLGKRGEKVTQRAPFVPDWGHVLIACDASQVDMRAIAGLCQDPAYMAQFGFNADGTPKDAHGEMAKVYFGTDKGSARHDTKGINHGLNYGQSAKAVSVGKGIPLDVVQAAVLERSRAYPRLIEWTGETQEAAGRGELLDNGFGRLMRADPDRAWTQGPALMGQGAARDLVCEAVLRFLGAYPHASAYLRGVVHDELVLSVPEHEAEFWREALRWAFTFTWRDVPILCDVSPAGYNWAECYAGE